ncbi:GFA family protein [Salinisphaera sp. SPP-AMP-43]|uniref:GFA family protein n=1 Tax=Salinisphaera sp. SPP-AMP-43 TaxID=3121288 RepID=UPI003C6E3612
MSESESTGRCACGGVRFRLTEATTDVIACHCETCRRWSGYIWGATHASKSALVIEAGDMLSWWASSNFAERGFCSHCGSSLFYRRHETERISIAPGALDAPTGLATTQHICVAEAGDYYPLDPGMPQNLGPEIEL